MGLAGVETLEAAGVLTADAGLVRRLRDGREFQIEIPALGLGNRVKVQVDRRRIYRLGPRLDDQVFSIDRPVQITI